MEKRILFTGAGRRVELLQAFRQAALLLDIDLKIYGAEMSNTAPALAYCDFIRLVCAMKDSDYIPQLVEICKNDKIDLVIPTIDTDLLVLSKNKEKFEQIGTKVLISKTDSIRLCRDKNFTSDFFVSCGLSAPKTYNNYHDYDGGFPCFIKPKDGSSSIDAYKIDNESELAEFANRVDDYVIQPFIDGEEYTVDIFCDFNSKPIYITPRKRLAVRAGEVLKTEIALDETIISECRQLIDKFEPVGAITVQLIKEKNTGKNYYIEINPRFGGGAPLSMKAGAKSAEAILKMLCDEKLEYQQIASDGAVFSRFDQSICIDNNANVQPIKGVIFDLDDTLYGEKQYVRSGYKKIAKFLGEKSAEEKLWQYFKQGKKAIDEYLAEINKLDFKDKCIEIYRNQMPDITLYDGVLELIEELKFKDIKVGIITDGRIEGQKNKIKALGLESLVDDIIITDELGGVQFRKPNDISFRIMQCRWKLPFEQIIYIGDNPEKDFKAPKQLGMRPIWFDNKDGLYSTASEIKAFDGIKEISNFLLQGE